MLLRIVALQFDICIKYLKIILLENLNQSALNFFVQLSDAVVVSFSATMGSVFHVGTSVTMMMTVGT